MQTIAYIRVSTNKQTVENQRSEIRRYCECNGLKLNQEILMEISSRKSQDKRRINELRETLNTGDCLIVSELSRLGRSTSEVIELVNFFVKVGVRLIMIRQNLDIKENDMSSKIIVTMFSLFAELERDLISSRTKEALAMRKQAGVRLGRPKGGSKYEPYRERIVGLLAKGVPVRQIAFKYLKELELNSSTGLRDYIKTASLTKV